MPASRAIASTVRVLAITHLLVGALAIIFGCILYKCDGLDPGFFVVCTGIWMCIAGGLGIPGSTLQRTRRSNLFASVFMGFYIISAMFGGIIIISFEPPKWDWSFLALGLIECATGIWVAICLCMMRPCCTGLEDSDADSSPVEYSAAYFISIFGSTRERQPLVNSVRG
ncbi:uncharacterized protein LOC141860200 [Acropora palmata]|uniref:uncharacterized protein LOC141860200 n=1 Tax=Acropora palmata TaxID=6131 RepID=UPI003DA161B6